MHKIYYWRGKPNFGDRLNWSILRFLRANFGYRPPEEANLVMVGSVLEHLPEGWTGTVCGAGKLREDSQLDLSQARVLALRGPLTLAGVKLAPHHVPVLGDPVLLITDWIQQWGAKYDLGVVPHWSDTELRKRFPYGTFIDVTDPPEEVVAKISKCKRIISSSLHGIMVADAYGIPRQAELFAGAEKEGGDFKFRDYAALYNASPNFGQMWKAPYELVEAIKAELRRVLRLEICGKPVDVPPIYDRVRPIRRGHHPQISLLVPFRNDMEERVRIWHWLRKYWKHHLPHAEIIQGHYTGYPFSKAAAVNHAAKHARGRIFVIVDADTYLDSDIVQYCADQIDNAVGAGDRKWFIPYRSLYRLRRRRTEKLIKSDPEFDYQIPHPPPPGWVEPGNSSDYGHPYGALIQIVPREAFKLVHGFDPRFCGWGSEDSSFLRAVDTLYCQHENTQNDVIHLWHVRPGVDWKSRRWVGQSIQQNSRLAQRYANATGEPSFMRGLVDEHEDLPRGGRG